MSDIPSPLPDPTYPGFNVLLFGPSGTGKTFSISTLVETGLEVFVLDIDAGLETLFGAYADKKKEIPPNLHWHIYRRKSQGFDQLRLSAENVGKFDLKGLASFKDTKRGINNPILDLLEILNDFPDQRTGRKWGSVDTWTNGAVLVIDSLSALNRMLWDMVVGTKSVRDLPDYGIVQNALMNLLHKLTSGCLCNFVLIAHVERETDAILGGTKLTLSAPGKAVNAEIPQAFSDVILTVRENDKFYWDTANSQADVKTRNLPIAAKQPADFAAIVTRWESRKKLATGV